MLQDVSIPHRQFSDPRVLRLFAHPVRLRILDALAVYGPATATELADRVDESPSNCSWHLRQLAKHGFVEAVPGNTGRQRPWRLVPWRTTIGDGDAHDDDLARAEDAAEEVLLAGQLDALAAWRATRRNEPAPWREAGLTSQTLMWLTAKETAALRRDLNAVIERHLTGVADRFDPQRRLPGSRPVRVVAWVAPGPSDAETPATRKVASA